jgi:hypothetical protein
MSVQFVTIDGQDNVVIGALLVLALGLQIALVVGYGLLLNLSLDKIRHAQLPAELVSR